jgi:hypothetical protein
LLTAIEIENFKAFGECQRIELRPITLLFGPNSGGKSSVTHALHYLREIALDGNVDARQTWSGGDALDLGGVRTFVHGKKPGPPITLSAEFNVEGRSFYRFANKLRDPSDENGLDEGFIRSNISRCRVSYEIMTQGRPFVSRIKVDINGRRIGDLVFSTSPTEATIENLNWKHPLLKREWLGNSSVDDDAGDFADEPEDSSLSRANNEEDTSTEEEYDDHIDDGDVNDTEFRESETDEGVDEEAIYYSDIDGSSNDSIDVDDYFADRLVLTDHADASVLGKQNLLSLLYLNAGGTLSNSSVLAFRKPIGPPSRWDEAIEHHWPGAAQTDKQKVLAADFHSLLSLLLLGPVRELAALLADFRHIGPLRVVPSRGDERPGRSACSLWSTGVQAWIELANGPSELLVRVTNWLEHPDGLDSGYGIERFSFKEVPIEVASLLTRENTSEITEQISSVIDDLPSSSRVILRDQARNILLQAQDVGVGISQTIPVLVALLDRAGGDMIAIEQPELHLHPKQQAALGDVLIESMNSRKRRIIIAETHSEHLILRLLRRIRETKRKTCRTSEELVPSQLRIAYVQRSELGARVSIIDADVNGDLVDPWPDDFFEQDFKERFT